LVSRLGPRFPTAYYPLAIDKVRYVGEAVVLIVGDSVSQRRTLPDGGPPTALFVIDARCNCSFPTK
jgi:hypothetical protein